MPLERNKKTYAPRKGLPGGSSAGSTVNIMRTTQTSQTSQVEPALDPPSAPWYQPRHLPHFNAGQETQMITYRLGDSLPLDIALRRIDESAQDADPRYRKRIEDSLDKDYGSCVLKESQYAKMVIENWHRFNGERYHLCAWVVMPNHVHILVSLTGTTSLSKIVQSWKSYTGRRLPVPWQREYWDRYIRDDAHFNQAVAYIHDNPVKSGLCHFAHAWPWSSMCAGSWEGRAPARP